MKKSLIPTLLVAGMLVPLAGTAQGATISSYSYTNAAEWSPVAGGIVGADDAAATAQALIDGVGRSGAYTPDEIYGGTSTVAGPEHTIVLQEIADLTTEGWAMQFDLGTAQTFNTIDLHYIVSRPVGIPAPTSVDVWVDSGFVGNFTGFDDSANGAFGDVRLNSVSLGSQNGMLVDVVLYGNPDTTGWGDPGAPFGWTGLTEVEIVPEPSAGLLLGLGALGLVARRRRR